MKQSSKKAALKSQRELSNPENFVGVNYAPECATEPNLMQKGMMNKSPETETPTACAGVELFCEFVGDTPMLELTHMMKENPKNHNVRVFAKLEFFNPGFSIKDRIVANILGKAEREGKLKKGMTVVAASSGNTGAATAMFCAMKGYDCLITTSPKCSKEKMDGIRAYGAQLVVSPPGAKEGTPDHYMMIATNLAAQDSEKYFDVNQYECQSNPEGHYLTLGPEIWEQTNGSVTHFIAAGSTGGTISGTGRYLKEQNDKIQLVLADPVGSIFTEYFYKNSHGSPSKFLVEGVGKGSIPGAMDFKLIDEVLPVTDQQAFDMCHRLAKTEGILAGGSAGLNVYAALELASKLEEPAIICTVMPDMGLKYLSKIYNEEWLLENNLQIPPAFPYNERCKQPESINVEQSTQLTSNHINTCSNFFELVGDTPLVDLSNVVQNKHGIQNIQFYAKVEFFNPGFSVNDRRIYQILQSAQNQGHIQPGVTTLVGYGEQAQSVALFATKAGFKCIALELENCSEEVVNAIKAYGATFIIPENQESHLFDFRQYHHTANTLCMLGNEIWEGTKGAITHFVAPAIWQATATCLKGQNPDIQMVKPFPTGKIIQQHVKTQYYHQQPADIDQQIEIDDNQAIQACYDLCKSQGLCVDSLSGLSMAAALKLANDSQQPVTIVALFPSLGLKQLSTVYNSEWLKQNDITIQQ